MWRGATISANFPRLSSQFFSFPIHDPTDVLLFSLGRHFLILQLGDFTGSAFSFPQQLLYSLLQGAQKWC